MCLSYCQVNLDERRRMSRFMSFRLWRRSIMAKRYELSDEQCERIVPLTA